MKQYERIFGSGPLGSVISIGLLIVSYYFEDKIGFRKIFLEDYSRYLIVSIISAFGLIVLIWSLSSLPVDKRGKKLVTEGIFKYFRHPLYAAFLLFLNMGLAFFLNNWIYILWAIVLFPIWSLIVRGEEELMMNEFGDEYKNYCKRTWRFVPKLF